MDEGSVLSKQPTSIIELKNLLQTCCIPNLDGLDKNVFLTLMTGFKLIVEGFQDKNDEASGDLAIQWLRLYLRTHSIASISDKKLFLYAKTTSIAISYILGWFIHGPVHTPEFTNEVLPLTLKLVRLTDAADLRKIEKSDPRIILNLWPILDVVQTYNLQLHILELIVLLLKNLSSELQYHLVSDMVSDEPDELKYMLLDLVKRAEDKNSQNLSRKILNLHNESREYAASILSFHCKALYLGKHFKFIKSTNDDRLWFDVNLKSNTLTFEGRTYLRKEKKYRKVDVVLKIAKMSIGSLKIIIQFKAPAEINGLNDMRANIQNIELAYIELGKMELNRFRKMLEATEFGKNFMVHVRSFCFGERFDNLHQQNNPNKKSNDSQVKVQNVKPFKKTPLDCLAEKVETEITVVQKSPEPVDEYDDLEVTDTEPCQSYKHFETNRPHLFADLISSQTSKKTKKRPAANDQNSVAKSHKKQRKTNDVSFIDASISKSVSNKLLTTKPKHSKFENVFDALKSNSDESSLSSPISSRDESINIAENSFNFPAKTKELLNKHQKHRNDANTANSFKQRNSSSLASDAFLQSNSITLDLNSTDIKLRSDINYDNNASFQEMYKSVTDSILLTNLKTSVSSQIKTTKQKHEHLVYKKRSDIESSSDDGDNEVLLEVQNRLKKKTENLKLSTLEKVHSTMSVSKSASNLNLSSKLNESNRAVEENVSNVLQDIQRCDQNFSKANSTRNELPIPKMLINEQSNDENEFLTVKKKFDILRASCLNDNNTALADTFGVQQGPTVGIPSDADAEIVFTKPVDSSDLLEHKVKTNLTFVPGKSPAEKAEMKEQGNVLIYYQRSDNESSSDEDDEILFVEPKQNEKNLLLLKSSMNAQTVDNLSLIQKNTTAANISTNEDNYAVHSHTFDKLKQPQKRWDEQIEFSDDKDAVGSVKGSLPKSAINAANLTITDIDKDMFSTYKNNEKTPPKNKMPTLSKTSRISRQEKLTDDEFISSGGSNYDTLTQLREFTPIKCQNTLPLRKRSLRRNPRRLFADQYATDSDTSANEFTEIIVIANTIKRRRHTMYDPLPRKDVLSMLINNIGDIVPNVAEYLHQ